MEALINETRPEAVHIIETFGTGPYMEYRIPGIIITRKGTLLCCYEGRMNTCDDWAKIDIVICRSTDGGINFSKQIVCASEEEHEQGAVTWNNPVLIEDGEMIHLIFHKNYEKAYYCFSRNDGITFSKPEDITYVFKTYPCEWNVCASGPGHGIVTQNGRLIVPVWIANGEVLDESSRKKAHAPSIAGSIYSDDRGKTWRAGALVHGVANANETTIAELPDYRILFNFRNTEQERFRVLGISEDVAVGFIKVWTEKGLPDPQCFGSMVSLDEKRIGFVNCANNDLDHPLGKRIYLTVYESQNEGTQWSPMIHVDVSGGYADIAVYGNQLYVFYEQCTWNKDIKRVNHLILKQFII